MKKRLIIHIFIFSFFSLWANPEPNTLSDSKIADFRLATLPKAGTHLLVKCLYLLGALPEISESKFGGITLSQKLQENHGWHLNAAILDGIYSSSHKYLIMVRDVRDAILSIHNWMPYLWIKLDRPDLYEKTINSFEGDADKQIYNLIIQNPDASGSSLLGLYHLAILLYNQREQLPNIMFIKFEDLIGQNGGGDLSKQCQTIKKIVEFLDIVTISDKEIQTIAEKLWGDTETFNVSNSKGQVGTWKKKLKREHIQAIDHHWNEYLSLFGYEIEAK
ncbi:MAG: hypothetical protein KR126chlam6_01395 [Candidatus Anoxychlamydiales bacterium]|nr:hypothetical protein [Candidatus Anoxychlamydiales bacterium]